VKDAERITASASVPRGASELPAVVASWRTDENRAIARGRCRQHRERHFRDDARVALKM
jgi:hypothetical protein